MGRIGVKFPPCWDARRGRMARGDDRHSEIVPALEEVGMGKWPAYAQNYIEARDKTCRNAQVLSQPLKADQCENLVRRKRWICGEQ